MLRTAGPEVMIPCSNYLIVLLQARYGVGLGGLQGADCEEFGAVSICGSRRFHPVRLHFLREPCFPSELFFRLLLLSSLLGNAFGGTSS